MRREKEVNLRPEPAHARRRTRRALSAAALALPLLVSGAHASTQAAAPNPVRRENARPGTTSWAVPRADAPLVEAYTSESSVGPGGRIHFHVSTNPPATYRIELYRLGWYHGAGGRLAACVPSCSDDEQGVVQPAPPPPDSATGEVDAGWPVTDVLRVPKAAVSGYYVANVLLTSGPGSGSAEPVPMIVRAPPARHSAILVQAPVLTWEAYNAWGGKSVYGFNSTNTLGATHVSFNRPYGALVGHQEETIWELTLVRFLERAGFDVSYQTDLDTSRNESSLLQHRLVITAGHGEYWTKEMRDAFDAALAGGTNLAFMGANTAYWQVRYEPRTRTEVAYKLGGDPEPDPALRARPFRELTPPRYECALLGIQHQGGALDWPRGDYSPSPAALDNPWFVGTGLTADSRIVRAVSVERDTIPSAQVCASPVTVLFSLDNGGEYRGDADAVTYRAPSGARVFASGSLEFNYTLDALRPPGEGMYTPVDPRVQRFMRNALADLAQPSSPSFPLP